MAIIRPDDRSEKADSASARVNLRIWGYENPPKPLVKLFCFGAADCGSVGYHSDPKKFSFGVVRFPPF